MKTTLFTFILCASLRLGFAQSVEKYMVIPPTVNVRSGAGTGYNILIKLQKGDEVSLIQKGVTGWFYIDYEGTQGYVSAALLKKDPYGDWEKKNYQSGVTPECENVIPRYDNELDNFLKINVGSNTDVVVKLMKKGGYIDECIRIVYVRSGEVFDIKNIPEGIYYLKIAYGKDYRQKIVNGQCYVRFLQNPIYEKGIEILDFNKITKPDIVEGNSTRKRWTVPSFELMLNVRYSKSKAKSFNSTDISEAQFNN